MSRVLRPTRHIIGQFRDEPFQAITCTDTDNTKQTGEIRENTPKTQNKQTESSQVVCAGQWGTEKTTENDMTSAYLSCLQATSAHIMLVKHALIAQNTVT